MNVRTGKLEGILLLEPRVFPDARGWFFESFNAKTFAASSIETNWVQDNVSRSTRGVVRGLHFQNPNAQSKLVTCLDGEIWDVVVDIRKDSKTFGQWDAFTLSSENHHQLYVPRGFAHGFAVVSERALVTYKCNELYSPGTEGGVIWNDPDLAIPWPFEEPALSPKDTKYPRLRDLPRERLF